MRNASLLLTCFLLLALSPWQSSRSQSLDIAQSIDQYLSIRTEMGKFSGAVLVAQDGKIILRKGYGFADVEKKIPYTPETEHEVASISKMFTAMAALKLRNQGKLRLDDSVCKYLDDCPETWKTITIQHLMRHTSGIPDYEEQLELGSDKYLEFMSQPDASAKILENAKKQQLDFQPGAKFHYSNTGYIILSNVIQRAAGQPFADFVAKSLLLPAGMKHSGYFGTRIVPKKLANGYTHGDIGWEKTLGGVSLTAGHLRKLPQLPLNPPAGDAGLYSTIDDLYRWSQIMDGSKLVSTEEAAEVFTPGISGYGYGWFIDRAFNRRRLRHNGILPGYVSDFIKFPDDKITIILFSNLDRARLSVTARDVSAIVLGAPYDLPVRGKVIKLTAEQIAKLEGDYRTSDGALLTIRNEPDYLVAEVKGQFLAGLIPLSPTEFYFPLRDGKVIFTLGDKVGAVRVNLRYAGEDHIAERISK